MKPSWISARKAQSTFFVPKNAFPAPSLNGSHPARSSFRQPVANPLHWPMSLLRNSLIFCWQASITWVLLRPLIADATGSRPCDTLLFFPDQFDFSQEECCRHITNSDYARQSFGILRLVVSVQRRYRELLLGIVERPFDGFA